MPSSIYGIFFIFLHLDDIKENESILVPTCFKAPGFPIFHSNHRTKINPYTSVNMIKENTPARFLINPTCVGAPISFNFLHQKTWFLENNETWFLENNKSLYKTKRRIFHSKTEFHIFFHNYIKDFALQNE